MHPSECMTLFELTSQIREVIGMGFPSTIWVTAEIASIRTNQSGHCYLDLVEKNDDRVVAQAKAIIWVYHYRSLLQAFENATGETLKKDLKVLFQVEVSYHPVYGLSLNILDIDPTYSLGEMARKKRETLDRLVREGLIDLNKQLSLALVPQRVAIISSPQAAGYGDFITHLQNNPWGYQFSLHLFPALVQGEGAAISISQALRQVRRKYEFFDLAVIVRGGGSQVDLSCFDDYQIAREIACLPLPVITGIGHERDDSVADRVAHTRMKTPTAVAEFILSGIKSFEDRIRGSEKSLVTLSEHFLRDQQYELKMMTEDLHHGIQHLLLQYANRNDILEQKCHAMAQSIFHLQHHRFSTLFQKFTSITLQTLTREDGKLALLEQALKYLAPDKVMKRGYSITLSERKTITSVINIPPGTILTTRVTDGSIISHVEACHEEK